MNILLLEPDFMLGTTYARYLRSHGHVVNWQRSSEEAVHALDTMQTDVIVTELLIPIHNGYEFLYEVRSYTDWQTIPIIIFSSVPRATVTTSMTYADLNISAYVYKPTTKLPDLLAAIKQYARK